MVCRVQSAAGRRCSRSSSSRSGATTGEDAGASKEAWLNWWQDNKRKLEVDKRRPDVAEKTRRTWERYWGEPYWPKPKKKAD